MLALLRRREFSLPMFVIILISLAIGFGLGSFNGIMVAWAKIPPIITALGAYGRNLFAIGNNPVAARFSGIDVNGTRFTNFAVMGMISGLVAIFFTSRIGSTRPNIADGWEPQVITMVVLGGVDIFGGRGNILGVIIAIFLLGFVRYGLSLVNVPGQVSDIVTGFLLLVAIMIPGMLKRADDRRGVRQEEAVETEH